MSTTHNFRNSIDLKLDQWEQYLERLENQLSESKEETLSKLNEVKDNLRKKIEVYRAEIEALPDLAKEKKDHLLKLINELLEKLNEKTDDAKESFLTQKEQIKKSLEDFETKAKEDISSTYHKAVGEIGKLGNSLHAHLDALEQKYEVERKKKTEQYDEKKTEFSEKIKKWKAVLHEKRSAGMEKLDTFEAEFMEGVKGVNTSFKNLFH